MDNFLLGINWTDLILVGLMARAMYIGAVQGVVVEFFKILGLLFAIFISAHYFSRLAGVLVTVLKILSRDGAELFFITALCLLITGIFSLVRSGWMVILKTDNQSLLSRFGGWLIGTLRGVLLCGLVIFMVMVSGRMALIKNVRHALAARYVSDLVCGIYEVGYEEAVRKVFPNEEKNKEMRRYRLAEFFKPK